MHPMTVHSELPRKAGSEWDQGECAEQNCSGSDPNLGWTWWGSSKQLHLDPVSTARLSCLNWCCAILGSCEDQKKRKEIKPQNPCPHWFFFFAGKKNYQGVKNSMVSIIYSVVFISGFGVPVNRYGVRAFFEKKKFKLSLQIRIFWQGLCAECLLS